MTVIKTSSLISTLMLIVFLTSCAMPGNVKPVPSGVTPTAIPEPLHTGYEDLLQEKIDSGEWTLEEGLVTMLKLFSGEIRVSEVDLGQGILDAEGTGVLQVAGNYLQTGTDQAAKDEITRLINILVPSQEALDRYSTPEEQASPGRGLKQAAPVDRDEDMCNTLWESGFPDSRTPVFPCFFITNGSVGPDTYKVFYPVDWRGDTSRGDYLAAALLAINASITEYQNYDFVKPIYFVFSNQEQPGNPDTLVWSYFETFRPETEEACPIIIFSSALTTLTIPEFQQKLAHEIFHCFQVRNFHDQLLGPGFASSNWWAEGTAEYFSNLVYPDVNYEHRYKANFAVLSTHVPLTEMAHENFAFFQYMGTAIGPAGVMVMIDMMPTTPGREAQVAALAEVPGIDVYFDEFVRTVVDNTLVDTDGTTITLPTSYTEQFLFFETAVSRVFTSQQPFVVARYWVIFAGEKEFTLNIEITYAFGGGGFSGWRYIDGKPGDWAPLKEIIGGCDPLHYVLYAITTTPGSERAETVTTTLVTEAPCDRCLIGNWQATNESVVTYMQSVLSASGNTGAVVKIASGTMNMNFQTDGTGASGYKNLILNQTGGDFVEGAEVIVTFDGSSSGRYTADGTQLTGLSDTTSISVIVEIMVNGASLGTTTTPFGLEESTVGVAHPTLYTCEGDTLTTWPYAEGVTAQPVIWTRSSL